VDREDPNRLVVRHLHAQGSDVLVSRDGGKTFKNVLNMTSAMYGFAKSPDFKTLWAGSGLPEHGIYRSTDRGESFQRVGSHGVLCLHSASADALLVCQNALMPGASVIGVSPDEGKTVTSLARFTDVQGAVECPLPDARPSLCSWPEMQATLVPDAGTSSDEPNDAGRRPKKRLVRDAGSAGVRPSDESAKRSACGCEVVGAAFPTADLRYLIAGVSALMLRVRRRISGGSLRIHAR
jgi:hypothetical protein